MSDDNDGWNSIPAPIQKSKRINELVKLWTPSTTAKTKEQVRFIGRPFSVPVYWMPIVVEKKGEATKIVPVGKVATNYDIAKHRYYEDQVCPFGQLYQSIDLELLAKKLGVVDITKHKSKPVASVHYYINGIFRQEQENEPARKPKFTSEEQQSGFKSFESKSWTPIQVARFPFGAINSIKEIAEVNNVRRLKDGSEVSYPASHATKGFDLYCIYDGKTENPQKKWQFFFADRSSLTEEEQRYLSWDIEAALQSLILSPDDAEREAKELKKKVLGIPSSSSSSSLRDERKTRRSSNEDDEDNYPLDLDGDDDGEDKPTSSKGSTKAKSKRQADDDDDFDLEDDDLAPSKSKPGNKGGSYLDDDDEENEQDIINSKSPFDLEDDDDDFDDGKDPTPRKLNKTAPSSTQKPKPAGIKKLPGGRPSGLPRKYR